jgi:hypothetical protein
MSSVSKPDGVMMENWLVIAGCTSLLMANSLTLLSRQKNVEWMVIQDVKKNRAKINEELSKYEHIFIADQFVDTCREILPSLKDFITVPLIEYHALHPDLCYAGIQSGIGDYHSIICVAGFLSGLSISKTIELYSDQTYEKAGYYSLAASEDAALVAHCQKYGYDIRPAFRRWGLRESFMYSINHPKVQCVYDIASLAMEKTGQSPIPSQLLPQDYLANGSIFPVYPEIAERFGFPGSLSFKRHGSYSVLSLEEFVASSFRAYQEAGAGLAVAPAFTQRFAAVRNLL